MGKDNETLNIIQEQIGDNSIKLIGEEDTFDFQCQQCGRCCMHRTDIILNPFDVYNGARYLGISTQEFLEKYTQCQLGGVSRIPIVLLTCDDRGWCPLLKFDIKDGGKYKCIINPAKPGACANHPIGTVREHSKKTDEDILRYVKVSQCDNSKGHNELHVVKDWCKDYLAHFDEIKAAHELQTCVESYFPCRLLDFLMFIILSATKNQEDLSHEFKDIESVIQVLSELYFNFQQEFISTMYSNYDINKPFIEQAEENKNNAIKNLFLPIKRVLIMFCKDMPETLKEIVIKEVGISAEEFLESIKDIDIKKIEEEWNNG